MSLLSRLIARLTGASMDKDREKRVRQLAQESEDSVRHAKEVLRRPPVLVELRRLDGRRPNGRSS